MGSNSKTMQCKVCPLLVLLLATSLSGLNVPGYPYMIPRSPTSYLIPSNFLSSSLPAALPYSIPANRAVICSACSCDNDFFCGWNCPKCSSDSFCSSCSCLTSLGCTKNCQSCKGPAQDSQGSPHLPVWHHQVLLPASLASFLSFTMEFSIRDAPSSSMDWLVCTASLHSGALPRWM